SLDLVGARLLADLARPLTGVDDITITGDPRLQLDDTIAVADPDGLTPQIRATVTGIRQQLTRGTFTTSLAVRPTAPAGMGLLDDPIYGLLDDTMILG
ncbi:MAG: hypothetical protein ACREX8_18345, partial [Gammaproteobacteria bacterium]